MVLRRAFVGLVFVGAACLGQACAGDDPNGVVGPSLDAAACPAPHKLFLNRYETTYSPGMNHSAANTTSIIASPATLSAFPYSDEAWTAVLESVRAKFEPFNLAVVDEEPDWPYIEIMITGDDATKIALTADTWWISPAACTYFEDGIGFVFVGGIETTEGEDPEALAWSATQSAAMLMGPIDRVIADGHVLEANYNGTVTSFLDETVPCGLDQPAECLCIGGSTTNSYAILTARLGAACAETP